MRQHFLEMGVLLLVLAVLLALLILDWTLGPEFWTAVPLLGVLGALMIWEALHD